MTEITRYTGNLEAFAKNATGTNRTVFDDAAQSDTLDDNINTASLIGWENVGVNDAPTKQDFNAMAFTNGQLHAYLHQVGVPEWDSAQEFYANKSFTNEAGILYRALTANTNKQPSSFIGVDWAVIGATVPSASETVEGIVERLTDAEAVTGTDTTRYVNAKQLKVVADAVEAGVIVQVVNTQTGEVATTATTMPDDNTKPQNTEGGEFMTRAITPASAANVLLVRANVMLTHTTSNVGGEITTISALFIDSDADALACGYWIDDAPLPTQHGSRMLEYYMVAGTTSPITFKIRGGSNIGGTTFNGVNGNRRLGGAMNSSITIFEIEV